jgi:hypothetical protein
MGKPAPKVGQIWMEIGRDVEILKVEAEHVRVQGSTGDGPTRKTRMKITTLHSKFILHVPKEPDHD